MLARALGIDGCGDRLDREAAALRERFEKAFWCEDIGTYALALDGRKAPCRVIASNAGQCLFTGIASEDHARRVADTLLEAVVVFRLGHPDGRNVAKPATTRCRITTVPSGRTTMR